MFYVCKLDPDTGNCIVVDTDDWVAEEYHAEQLVALHHQGIKIKGVFDDYVKQYNLIDEIDAYRAKFRLLYNGDLLTEWDIVSNKNFGSVTAYSLRKVISDRIFKFVIPEFIHSIYSYCFDSCNLEYIEVPKSVKHVASEAFMRCNNLKVIKGAENFEQIGARAFADCNSLESIELNDNITEISIDTFIDCTSLKRIKLPRSLEYINFRAFSGCKSLTDITLPNGLKEIGERAFKDCHSLKHITIPASVERIESQAFYNCSGLETMRIECEFFKSLCFDFISSPNGYTIKQVEVPKNFMHKRDFEVRGIKVETF